MSTTVRVKPSNKHGLELPPPTPLSAFDLLMPPVYVPLYLFFRPSFSPFGTQKTASDLISALADVLEHFPGLAGSIQPDDSGRPHVHSDRRGMDFVYEVREKKFPGIDSQDLCPRDMFPDPNNGDETLIAIKFTSFSCGSHILVVSFSHILIDLTSAMDFVRAFASQAIGKPLVTVPKNWTRNPVEQFPDVPALLEVPAFTILPPGQSLPPPSPPAPSEQVFFYVSTKKLAKLKLALELSVSDFQLLSAVIWRASATHCLADASDDDTLCLGIAANGRERSPDKIMSKEHYFGNFITDVCVCMKKSDLLADGSLSSVAAAIKIAIKEQLTPEYIAGRAKTLQSVLPERLVPQIQTRLTSWPKDLLDTGDLHFGLVKPGKGKVVISPGDDVQFPIGTLHVMMASENVYRVQVSVPVGKGQDLKSHPELIDLANLSGFETASRGCSLQ